MSEQVKEIKQVDFYFDIKCPFAHMASTRLHELENICPVPIIWKPVLLAGLLQFSKAPQGKKPPSTIMSPTKRKYNGREVLMQKDQLKVKQIFPKEWPMSSLHIMRLLTAIKDNNIRKKCAIYSYNIMWDKGMDIRDKNILSQIANKFNTDIEIINNESIKKELYNNTKEAVDKYDIIGVPSIVINNKYMFYGYDRFPFVKQILLYGELIHAPLKRMLSSIKPIRTNNIIEYYFDFVSPFAYLGYKRLNELNGFSSNIILKPIYLRGLMEIIKSPPPFSTYGILKRKLILKDMIRWFKASGLNYDMVSLRKFKRIDSALPLKVFLVNNSTVDCIFNARWQQNINIGNENKLIKVLNDNGFDGKILINKAKLDINIQNALEGNTKFAANKGIFGVPTFVINGDYNRYIWGQDRMCWVKDVCCGWKPPALSAKL